MAVVPFVDPLEFAERLTETKNKNGPHRCGPFLFLVEPRGDIERLARPLECDYCGAQQSRELAAAFVPQRGISVEESGERLLGRVALDLLRAVAPIERRALGMCERDHAEAGLLTAGILRRDLTLDESRPLAA